MKKHYFLILFYQISFSVFSQNYQPFKKDCRYQFINRTNDTITSLKIDSVYKNMNDSVFIFNPVFRPEHSQSFNNGKIDSNNVFGAKMVKKDNGDYLFTTNSNDTFLIKTKAVLHVPWDFYKSKNIKATMIEKKDTLLHGIKDSVMLIQLSDNNSIILSKTLGLISSVNFNAYFNHDGFNQLSLTAIPEVNIGKFLSNPLVYYNFEVGDIFVRYKEYFYASVPIIKTYEKKEILERTAYGNDSIFYKVKSISVYLNNTSTNTGGHNIIDTTIYIEKYYKQKQKITNPPGPQHLIYSPNVPCLLSNEIVDELGFYSSAIIYISEPDHKVTLTYANISIGDMQWNTTYKEGLGQTYYNDLSVQPYISGNTDELLCYIKKSEMNGDCSIFDQLLANTEAAHTNALDITYNPQDQSIQINIGHKEVGPKKVGIYDLFGREVALLEMNFQMGSNIVATDNLPSGLYFVHVEGMHHAKKSFVKF